MEQLKAMKETLIAAAQGQMGNLEQVNAKELGEVIDMIKDLEEAVYYCSIVKAMDDSKEEKKDNEKAEELMSRLMTVQNSGSQSYYTPYTKMPNYIYEPDRMYYGGNSGTSDRGGMTSSGMGNSTPVSGNNYYGGEQGYMPPYQYPPMMMTRDYREGRSGQYRKGYMEGKEQHKDKNVQLQELEKYITELGQDVTEMIRDASPEEKMLLQQKLSTLANKVNV